MSYEPPRRVRIDLFTPAEKAICDAVQAVEALPPDERLTSAVNLLGRARDLVADFVDGVPFGKGYPRPSPEPDRDAYGAQCVRYRQGLGELDSMLNFVRRADGRPNKEDVESMLAVLKRTINEADALTAAVQHGEEVKQ